MPAAWFDRASMARTQNAFAMRVGPHDWFTSTLAACVVSMLFAPAAMAQSDTTAPRIVAVTPDPKLGVADNLGVATLVVQFSETVVVPTGAVKAWTVGGGPASSFQLSQDIASNTLTLTFAQPIVKDRLTIVLDYAIADLAGNALDGEVLDPSKPFFPSGNGQRGGQAVFRINVLQGDANRDGVVSALDGQAIAGALGSCAGDPAFDARFDLNRDGCVNALDVAIWQQGMGGALPPTDGASPAIAARTPEINESLRAKWLTSATVTLPEPVASAHLEPRSLFALGPDGVVRPASAVALATDSESGATTATFSFQPALSQTGVHRLQLSNAVADSSGELLSPAAVRTWNVTVDNGPTPIAQSSPYAGEQDVALTRESIIFFKHPVADQGIDGEHFVATFANEAIPALVKRSSDGHKVTLFYQDDLPPSALVRVTVVGDGLKDDLGFAPDVDGDGQPGGTQFFDFQTVTLTTLPNTAICGRVFASELGTTPEGEPINVPLEGATITVDGAERTLFAITDSKGSFRLDPAPVGTFFVHVDGRTATVGVPEGAYYPFVGKAWTSIAGQEVNVGNIYLPLVPADALAPVSDSQETIVPFPPSVLSKFPEFAGVQVTVPAGSLYANNGVTGGKVGIAPVPPDRLPGELPPELNFPLVITVQTASTQDGGMAPENFDVPVPVKFPNLPDPKTGKPLPPGSKSALWSFDHDKGRFEVVGPMTVSEDGMFVVTDEGFGIIAPGWHGTFPGCQLFNDLRELFRGPCGEAIFDLSVDVLKAKDSVAGVVSTLKSAARGTLTGSLAGGTLGAGYAVVGAGPGAVLGGLMGFTYGFVLAETKGALTNAVKQALIDSNVVLLNGLQNGTPPAVVFSDVEAVWNNTFNGLVASGLDPIASFNKKIDDSWKAAAKVPDSISEVVDECFEQPVAPAGGDANDGQDAGGGGGGGIAPPDYSQAYVALAEAQGWSIPSPQQLQDFNSAVATFVDVANKLSAAEQKATQLIADAACIQVLLAIPEPDQSALALLAQCLDRLNSDVELVGGLQPLAKASYEDLSDITSPLLQGNTDPVSASGSYALYRWEGSIVRRRSASSTLTQALPVQTFVNVALFYPVSGDVAETVVLTGANGSVTSDSTLVLGPAPEADSDADGLPDAVEEIVGTDVDQADTDGDGIPDGAEVQQGTDPLDGLVVQTGIVQSVDTPGVAQDIAAFDDVVVLADGSSGVRVFNVFNAMQPTVIAQVATSGAATAVAFSGDGTRLAVAMGSSGLGIVDFTDPPASAIVHQIAPAQLGGTPRALVMAGGLVYVGTDAGSVVSVELTGGSIVEQISLSAGVQDLFVQGETLYALTSTQLVALRLLGGPLAVLDTIAAPGNATSTTGRRRLFVGGGIAYVTSSTGYSTFAAGDPANLSLVAAGGTQQFGWKHMVANGSGLGVACVSPNASPDGPHEVSLYDLSSPAQTDVFITQFTTPGLARAVSLYNGRAYVADSASGLQVVNYLPYDALGIAPEVSFETTVVGGAAQEGSLILVIASVADDVQVRNVELLINGQKTQTDGNFPFEFFYQLPILPEGQKSAALAIAVRASDTGGNWTTAPAQSIDVTPDVYPPTVVAVSPSSASPIPAAFFEVAAFGVEFSEPMAPKSVEGGAVTLTAAAKDGVLGTADDLVIPIEIAFVNQNRAIVVTPTVPVPVGNTLLRVSGSIATDTAGNLLDGDGDGEPGGDAAIVYSVTDQPTIVWDGGGDGMTWSNALNWSGDVVPGPTDAVLIDVPGSPTIRVTTGTQSVLSLTCAEALQVQGGTLKLAASSVIAGAFTLSGGVFEANGQVLVSTTLSQSGGTLTGAGEVTVTGALSWTGGTMMGTGTTTVGAGATGILSTSSSKYLNRTLRNLGATTYAGFNVYGQSGAGKIANEAGGVFTIAGESDLSCSGCGTANVLTNAGTLVKSGAGATELYVWSLVNTGTVQVDEGTLILYTSGSSSGELDVSAGATLWMESGAFTIDVAGAPVTGAGTVRVSGATLSLPQAGTMGPSVVLEDGTMAASAALTVPSLTQTGGTLDGAGEVTVTGALSWTGGTMMGTGTTTVGAGATGILSTSSSKYLNRTLRNLGATTYAGFNVYGQSGAGKIANEAGGVFTIAGESDLSCSGCGTANVLTNAGTLVKSGAGATELYVWSLVNTGTVQVDEGTLILYTSGSSSGELDVSAGATLWMESGAFTIDVAGAPVTGAGTVRVSGATLSLPQAGTMGPSVVLEDGTMAASAALTVPSLTQTGGTLDGAGEVTVTGALSWTGGTMMGTGTTTVGAGATGILSTSSSKYLNRTLRNLGATTYAGFNVYGQSGAGKIANEAGGVFTIAGESDLSCSGCGTANVLTNAGTLVKSGAGATELYVWSLVNTGTVQVDEGTLILYTSGSSSGELDVSAGATLWMESGAFTIDVAGAPVTGAGTVRVSGATLSLPQAGTMGPSVVLEDGTMAASAALTVPSLTQTGGTLDGAGEVTVTGALSWTGGTMMGTGTTTVGAGATGILSTSSSKYLNRTLRNLGATTYAGFNVYGQSGAGKIANEAGGVFTIAGESDLSCSGCGTANVLTNAGTLVKSGAGATELYVWSLVNTGTVQVDEGTLILYTSGSSSGELDVSAGATLWMESGAFTIDVAGAPVTGAGTVRVSGATLSLPQAGTMGPSVVLEDGTMAASAALTVPSLTQTGGTLDGAGEVTVTGALSWTGGTMMGTGTTTVGAGATGILSTSSSKYLNRTLRNLGATTYAGFNVYGQSGAGKIANEAGGVFTIAGESDLSCSGCGAANVLTNAGTLVKSGEGTTQLFQWSLLNTGQIQVQSGTLQCSSGLTHSGQIDVLAGAILNASTLSMSGTPTTSTQLAGTAATQQGRVIVSGTATLGGTLALELVDGFVPSIGNTFDVLTYGSRVGQFSIYEGLDVAPGVVLQPNYLPTKLQLQAIAGLAAR